MNDPEDHAIDVTIEALTGTVYDLCVSPFETILGIKLKIQRLEGIPVYQQHLVHGGMELQDEFCLEEYGVQSGAQLKLLIAMRGGPIHAHRVHLEDPTLYEIAELLESTDHKYTVMLLRDGDAIDFSELVQLCDKDSCESVRSSCSPVPVSESRHGVNVAAGDDAQTEEHALTRDKMKELMSKLKKVRGFGKYQPIASRTSGTQLQGKGTAKVLILNSRTSSRLLQSSSHGPSPVQLTPAPTSIPTPQHSQALRADRRLSAQRCLRFCPDNCSCQVCSYSGVTRASVRDKRHHRHHHHHHMGRGVGKRARSPDEETPVLNRKHYPRVEDGEGEGHHHSHPHHHHHHRREWRKMNKKTRRLPCSSGLDKQFSPQNVEGEKADPVGELTSHLSQLALEQSVTSAKRASSGHMATFSGDVTGASAGGREMGVDHGRCQSGVGCTLPQIVSRCRRPPPLTRCSKSVASQAGASSLCDRLPTITPPTAVAIKQSTSTCKKKSRCMECGKKMGLATTYGCRCGGVFCAVHRYAETHACSFDYKTEGREFIARSNPVVTAPKLPKL